ncbi:MAG: hypothetical protein QOI74_3042 [Micromonosporaceae bacterium]|nr:hypothetical protein [Micromonosporaceae bacterium]
MNQTAGNSREHRIAFAAVFDEEMRGRLRNLVAAHDTPDGVLLDSRAWVITARRR